MIERTIPVHPRPPAVKHQDMRPVIPFPAFRLNHSIFSSGGAAVEPERQNPEPVRRAIDIAMIQDVEEAFECLQAAGIFALRRLWATIQDWGEQMTDRVNRLEGRIVRLEDKLLRVRRPDSSDSGSGSE
jgi:hypothetical protein